MTAQTPTRSIERSPAELVAHAAQLRELIRDQAEEAEGLGHYNQDVHKAFLEAGFYQLLTPRRYGGLEVDLRTFAKIVMEVGRGDPGTAWCLCLGQGHALTTAALWPEKAQDEVFNNASGYFRASHAFNPAGTAKRVPGGLLINANSRYQSGVPYATHATVSVVLVDEDGGPADAPPGAPPGPPPGAPVGAPSEPPPGAPAGAPPMPHGDVPPSQMLQVLIPKDQFTIVENWGADAVLGMRASGSNSITVENQIVPEHYAITMSPDLLASTTSHGVKLHGNPMYLGAATGSFFQLELVVSVIGAARAALDEYERLARTRTTAYQGGGLRNKDPFYQRDFGAAKTKTDAATAIACYVADTITELSSEAIAGTITFTPDMDIELGCMLMQAGHLAAEAVDILFASAGTSASGRGQRMQRYLRDVWMYRTHIGAQYDPFVRRSGAGSLGDPQPFFL